MRHPPCLPGQYVAARANWADPKIAQVSPNRQGCPAALGVSPQSSLLPGCRMLSPAWLAALHPLRRFRKLQIAVPRYVPYRAVRRVRDSLPWMDLLQTTFVKFTFLSGQLGKQVSSKPSPASSKLFSSHCLTRRWHRLSCSGPRQACACPRGMHHGRPPSEDPGSTISQGPDQGTSQPARQACKLLFLPAWPGCGLHAATATTQAGAVCV